MPLRWANFNVKTRKYKSMKKSLVSEHVIKLNDEV